MNVIVRFFILILIAGAAVSVVECHPAFGQNEQEAVETPSENTVLENAVTPPVEETPHAPQPQTDTPKFTMVFELTSVKASDLAVKVEEMLTKDVGKVKFDEASNKLVVTDTAAKIEEIRKLVDASDQRDRPILVEAKTVQISLNDEHRMGVDWEAIVSDYRGLNITGDPSDAEQRGALSVGTIANDDYSVLLEALDTVGDVNIISSSGITAVNNKESHVWVGSSQSAATASAPVENIDGGIKLFITPTMHADGTIAIQIRPETGVQTTVNAKAGTTIVIGGLIKEEKARTIKKVPLLGDVPLLGIAFRSYSHSVKKTEFVVFLTPKISTEDTAETKSADGTQP